MQIFNNPPKEQWPALVQRRLPDDSAVEARVADILDKVRKGGDSALRSLAREIEGFVPESFTVSEEEISEACGRLPESLKAAIREAYARISEFHGKQIPQELRWEDGRGVVCSRRFVPLNCAGLYVPGGSAPLFSTVLMLAIPAGIAGCPKRILCTPPDRQGRIADPILFAADLCGIDTIYKIGGAQAIAAMAFGTDTVCRADKIFGPGNRYVMKAKQLLNREGMAIDIPAGPSEVMVVADGSAIPAFVAADLLSQAEHGPDSQVMLICESEDFAKAVQEETEIRKARLPREDIAGKALQNSRIIVLPERKKQIAFANLYAAEHLIVSVRDADSFASAVTAAGCIFLGNWSPESAGDYAAGTNHTLPTSGLANSWSGLGVESFMHAISMQRISPEGLSALAPTIIQMAEVEGLRAHAEAVRVRLYGKD